MRVNKRKLPPIAVRDIRSAYTRFEKAGAIVSLGGQMQFAGGHIEPRLASVGREGATDRRPMTSPTAPARPASSEAGRPTSPRPTC